MDGLQPKPNEEYSANDQTEENIHKRSLYDRLGGENNIILIVDYFYEFVQLDNLVNYFFFRSDMIQQRNNMKKYMTFLTGGSI